MQAIWDFFKNDRFAEHNGIELLDIAPGYAKAKMEVKDRHLNGVDVVHGGAIFTLASSPWRTSPLPPRPTRTAP